MSKKALKSFKNLHVPRRHPRASGSMQDDELDDIETRIGGDRKVLAKNFRRHYDKPRVVNGKQMPGRHEYKRRDSLYRLVCCSCCLTTVGSFIFSMHLISKYILPASKQLYLEGARCYVRDFMVADASGGQTIPDGQDQVDPLKCWYYCDGIADPACTKGLHRGYGYCVQLNVTFEVETEPEPAVAGAQLSCVTRNVSNSSDSSSNSSDSTGSSDSDSSSDSADAGNSTVIYCDEIPPPTPPMPPTPPSPSLPPGGEDVEPRTFKNESCPVVLPTLRFGEDVNYKAGAEGKLEYKHPDFYPGYTDDEKGLALRYQAVADLSAPYNRSYINPFFSDCSETNGYQCTRSGESGLNYVSTSCSVIDCRPTAAEAKRALTVLEATYHEGYGFACEYMSGSVLNYMRQNAHGQPEITGYTALDEVIKEGITPVFITREYSLWFLVGQSLGIALGMCMCYSGCYFLCCREWWCQYDCFRRFQYF